MNWFFKYICLFYRRVQRSWCLHKVRWKFVGFCSLLLLLGPKGSNSLRPSGLTVGAITDWAILLVLNYFLKGKLVIYSWSKSHLLWCPSFLHSVKFDSSDISKRILPLYLWETGVSISFLVVSSSFGTKVTLVLYHWLGRLYLLLQSGNDCIELV